jgi:hypothetical protein
MSVIGFSPYKLCDDHSYMNHMGNALHASSIYEGHLKSSWTHLLLQVRTLWRCGDSLFFKVPPLASDALLTTLHPLLKNVLQTCLLQASGG